MKMNTVPLDSLPYAGYKLIKMRQRLKLSQPALAAAIGTTRDVIANYETGRSLFTDAMLTEIKLKMDPEFVYTHFVDFCSDNHKGENNA